MQNTAIPGIDPFMVKLISALFARKWNAWSASNLVLAGALFFVAITVLGCAAAYNARTGRSPDWKYSATCYVRGTMGHSYIAETKKTIVISIFALPPNAKERSGQYNKEAEAKGQSKGTNNPDALPRISKTLLFRKDYLIKASALEWKAEWKNQHDLSIVFYDFGPNIEKQYAGNKTLSERLLCTNNFRFDPRLETYVEALNGR